MVVQPEVALHKDKTENWHKTKVVGKWLVKFTTCHITNCHDFFVLLCGDLREPVDRPWE